MTSLPTGVVTFLLTDVEGSTRLWEQHPAAMADALAMHDQLIDQAVSCANGVVLKARGEGDATFCVFARASDAALAARDIQQALAATDWPDGVVLRVRIAIHMGEAIERDGDYFGPAVNRVARLRGIADGGEILLSRSAAEVLLDHAAGGWTLDELGERQLKDLRRPEAVWRLRTSEAPAREDAAEQAEPQRLGLPPMLSVAVDVVGREGEMTELRDAWSQAQAGAVRVVLLGGEPGVGKTTLASRISQEAFADGALVIAGRNDEHLRGAHQAVIEAFGARIDAMDSARLLALGRHAAELVRLFPDIATRVPGLPPPTTTEPDAERWLVNSALVEVLVGVEQPVLIVFDDLQWASPTTIQFVDHLVRHPGGLRVLVVGTYRDTETADPAFADLAVDLHREQAGVDLHVEGLTREAVTTLIETTAGHTLDAAARELASAVHRETGGNPFFIREVLRDLAESGAIAQVNDQWHSTTESGQFALPDSVKAVLDRRLARLDDDCRHALTVAAVAGGTFRLDLVEAVWEAGVSGDALDALERASDAGLITEQGAEFAFSHALVRQAVLSALGGARRCRLHRRIGEALEGQPHADLNATAYHFSRAADGDSSQLVKAVEHVLRAAEAGLEVGAYDQVIGQLEAVISVINHAPSPDIGFRCDVLTTLIDAKAFSGAFIAADEIAVKAWADAKALDDPIRMAKCAVASVAVNVGTPDELALGRLNVALDRLSVADDAPLRVRLLLAAANAAGQVFGDHERELELVAEAQVTATAGGCGDYPATKTMLLGGEVALADKFADHARMLAIADELDGLPVKRHIRRGFSPAMLRRMVAWARGDADALEAAQAGCEAEAERTRSWTDRYEALTMRILRPLSRGDWATAERELASMLEIASIPNAVNVWAANSILLARDLGKWEAVYPLLDAAVEDNPGLAGYRAGRALARAELGDISGAAADLAHYGSDAFSTMPHDQTHLTTLAMFGEVAALIGGTTAAAALLPLLEPYSEAMSSIGSTVSVGALGRYVGMLAAMVGRADADTFFERALAVETRLGATAYLVRTKSCYARVLAGRGERGRAEPLWADAYAVATQLDMVGVCADIDLARARSA